MGGGRVVVRAEGWGAEGGGAEGGGAEGGGGAAAGQFTVPGGLVCSLPVRCKGRGAYEVVRGLPLTPFAVAKIRASVDELLAELLERGEMCG